MTLSECPTVLECPSILVIIEQCLSEHRSVLDPPVVEKIINICASCGGHTDADQPENDFVGGSLQEST